MTSRTNRAVALVLVVASVLLPVLGSPATAASSFTFHGSGNGHGLGMSQWGAYGLAKMGWSPTKILTHFYRGTAVGARAIPARVRVGISYGRDLAHVTAKGGRVDLWEGEPGQGVLVGQLRRGDTWTLEPRANEIAVRDENGELVGGRRWGGPSRPLVLEYGSYGARVEIPEAGDYGSGAYGRGTIEIRVAGCAGSCELRFIARLGLDEYLYGLGEVPSSWPAAALRAQVIAARSYAVVLIKRGLRGYCDCQVTDGTIDQVYVGWSKEAGVDGDRWVAAVDDTSGKVVTYDGDVIQAFYASSDGGHSEDVEDVWHAGNPAYAIPWLRGVCDPGESTSANSWTDWERSFDAGAVTSRLRPYTGSIGTVRSLTREERGESGRIITIRAVGSTGSATIEGTELRAALGLPDTRVWVNADRNIEGPIRERYDRLGCAPGLATSATRSVAGGAQQFFADGGLYRNTGRAIVVWLRGAIDREYRAVGAGTGVLGLPLGGPVAAGKTRAACADCKRVAFVSGRIFWKAGTGAHALWGRVLEAYAAEGGATGTLGFPLTRVKPLAGGGDRARFEHGNITCPPGEECTVTRT